MTTQTKDQTVLTTEEAAALLRLHPQTMFRRQFRARREGGSRD